jgi:hypothetical protein
MKGVIHNLLEAFVCEAYGDDAYEELLAACPAHARGPHVGPGTYADGDFYAIAAALCHQRGIKPDDALRAFGAYAAPRLARKVPVYLDGHTHPRSFLATVDDIMDVEVKKLHPGGRPPQIICTDGENPDELYVTYASARQLCPLVLGMLDGVAAMFEVPITTTHLRCTRTGAATCELHLHFGVPASERAA